MKNLSSIDADAKIVRTVLDFLKVAERLKSEPRHSWLSNGDRETVAAHTWQMSLLAMLVYRNLAEPIQIEKALKMIIVHDLVEAETGDTPFFDENLSKEKKAKLEQAAIEKIQDSLCSEAGEEIYDLFQEFELGLTLEAKFAKALDNLEVQIQHNMADLSTWNDIEFDLVYTKMDKHCSHDPFLNNLCAAVKLDAEEKMRASGIDPVSIKHRSLAAE